MELIRLYNDSFNALKGVLSIGMADGGPSGSMIVNLECKTPIKVHKEKLSVWYSKEAIGLKSADKLTQSRKMDESIHQAFKDLLIKVAEDFASDEMKLNEPVETDDFPF